MTPFKSSPSTLLSFIIVCSMRWNHGISFTSHSYININYRMPKVRMEHKVRTKVNEQHKCCLSTGRTRLHMGSLSTPPGFLRSSIPHFPWHRLPNILTYLRCIAVPIFILAFIFPIQTQKNVLLTTIFGFASITDYLDGALARRWNVTSPFGAFLDPVADKLMVSTALILLSGHCGTIVSVPTAIILAREIAISALREWMAQQSLRDTVKVGWQGKVKTALTMIAIFLLLVSVPLVPSSSASSTSVTWTQSQYLWTYGIVLLYVSTLLTWTSAYTYFKAAASVWTR